MIDDRHQELLLQHESVDLKKVSQVELWTDVLDIYTADLFNAVAIVGTSSATVLQYIVDNGLVGRSLRTPEPKPKTPGKGPTNAGSPQD